MRCCKACLGLFICLTSPLLCAWRWLQVAVWKHVGFIKHICILFSFIIFFLLHPTPFSTQHTHTGDFPLILSPLHDLVYTSHNSLIICAASMPGRLVRGHPSVTLRGQERDGGRCVGCEWNASRSFLSSLVWFISSRYPYNPPFVKERQPFGSVLWIAKHHRLWMDIVPPLCVWPFIKGSDIFLLGGVWGFVYMYMWWVRGAGYGSVLGYNNLGGCMRAFFNCTESRQFFFSK